MEKPNIVVDVDGVILDFNALFTDWWNKKYSEEHDYVLPKNPKTWDYDWTKDIKILKDTMTEFIDSDPIFGIIHEEFPLLLAELGKKYKINIVTAYHREDSRKKNLEIFDIKYDEIYFANNTNKVEIIKSLNPVMIFEDSPIHVNNLANENAEYDIYVPTMWNYTQSVLELPKVIPYHDIHDLSRKILV